MIYRLQRKFILICAISILLVIALVFGIIVALNVTSMNRNLDVLADSVSSGGGSFPMPDGVNKPSGFPPSSDKDFNFITPETPFSTRHFTVLFNRFGEVERVRTEFIYSITETQAVEYAEKALEKSDDRGWLGNYRYKIYDTNTGRGIVFIDGSINRALMMQSTTSAGLVLLVCAAVVLVLIVLLSKRAVKPIADSYEKQKQFVTDANHELKTPLALILTNVDIAEGELGRNEWLSDIRYEGHRMNELVNQLVALSRMDEETYKLNVSELDLSDMLERITLEFEPLAKERSKSVFYDIEDGVTCSGDAELLSRLIGILLENAVKYCDAEGEIRIALQKKKHVVLTVENTYGAVDEVELNRIFDRFYRADKARTYTGGYGIGLAIAKEIVEKHKGSISSYKKNGNALGIRVTLKK